MSEAYKNDLEEHLLVDLHKLLIPLVNVGSLLAGIRVVISRSWRIGLVLFAPLDNLLENGFVDLECGISECGAAPSRPRTHVGNRDGLSHGTFAEIVDHVLDED